MLVLRILATILVAISFITAYMKNNSLFEGEKRQSLQLLYGGGCGELSLSLSFGFYNQRRVSYE